MQKKEAIAVNGDGLLRLPMCPGYCRVSSETGRPAGPRVRASLWYAGMSHLDQYSDRTPPGLALSVRAQRVLPNAICHTEMRPEESRQPAGDPHPPDAAAAPARGGRRGPHLHLRRAQGGVPDGGGGGAGTANGLTVGSVANDPANFTGLFPRCLRQTPSI